MAKSKKKPKKPKPRIKVASGPKKRKNEKALKPIEFTNHQVHEGLSTQEEIGSINACGGGSQFTLENCGGRPEKGCLDKEESQTTWVDSFFAIFGFKRKTPDSSST